MGNSNFYSKNELYENRIKDYVKRILILCEEYQIPVFMTFALENTDTETVYETEMLSAAFEGKQLTDDKIAKHALVMNGFEVVPENMSPRYIDQNGLLEKGSE